MTAKRFTIDNDMNFNNKVETYELNCIRDNENQTFYFIADSIENVQLFVKRLNELNEENEQLKKQFKEQRHEDINELSVIAMKYKAIEKENEQLKQELQRMYDVATLNKAIEVLENEYDKMLSDGSDEVKDAMRHTVLRCIEDLDELKDDITAW